MARINGKIDTEWEADKIVKHILLNSLVKYHGTRLSNDEVKELKKYVQDILESIIRETKNNHQ